MGCKAINKTGQPCRALPLVGEEYCLFHSVSERGRKYRRTSRVKKTISRKELLRALTRDFRNTEKLEIVEVEKIKIRQKLGFMIQGLLNELEKISELEELARDVKYDKAE